MTQTAVIYTRISRDSSGDAQGVTRQEEDCRQLAQRRGWTVTEVCTDNDISASGSKRRPQFERLLTLMQEGQAPVVIAWNLDRLTRNSRDRLRIIETGKNNSVVLALARGSDIDLSTPSGRLIADVLSSIAQNEIEVKGEREKAANLQRARQGRPQRTTRRCFGFEDDGLTPREQEAQALRDGYQLIMSGGSIREVARRWNARGLRGPQAQRLWDGATVSRTLRLPRHAGYVTYHGEIMNEPETGKPVQATWPAIVDPDLWHSVQAVLNDPSRRSNSHSVPRLLLSGLATCAVCGAPIQSGGTRRTPTGMVQRIRCSAKSGHVYREAGPVERYVEQLVMERLARPDLKQALTSSRPETDVAQLRAKAAEIRQRQDAMAVAFADGQITASQFAAANERFKARLAEIEAAVPTDTASAALGALVTARDIRRSWAELSTDAKRGVINALMSVELIPPGTKENACWVEDGEKVCNPDTLTVTWR